MGGGGGARRGRRLSLAAASHRQAPPRPNAPSHARRVLAALVLPLTVCHDGRHLKGGVIDCQSRS